ncbi:unnamed protein product [Camellia sinensis]
MGSSRGPSPLVPLVMVGVFALLIFGPLLQSVVEAFSSLYQEVMDYEGGVTFLILLCMILLLMVMYLLSLFFPTLDIFYTGNRQSDEDEGFGLGSFLLALLFFALYVVMVNREED